ncbi:MAG: AI-2E family transporter [Myxococcales bacterium]|jgi:predicted PurR-regulated permease PerM|nr:MAG: AI-2E family transporter [Myxococcales bacterium]
MSEPPINAERWRTPVVLVLTLTISAVFLEMIRNFLIALFLAAVFSSPALPMHAFLTRKLRRRSATAATLTLVFITVVVVPLLTMLGVVVAQGSQIIEEALPWLKQQLQTTDANVFELPA